MAADQHGCRESGQHGEPGAAAAERRQLELDGTSYTATTRVINSIPLNSPSDVYTATYQCQWRYQHEGLHHHS